MTAAAGSRPRARALYLGETPADYTRLNSERDLSIERRRPKSPKTPPRATFRRQMAELLEGLDRSVRIVSCPFDLPPRLSQDCLAEMKRLRTGGRLSALRGNRPTDLARPLAADTARFILDRCPNLAELLNRLESLLNGTDLFVRAVKLDRARASSTDSSEERAQQHLHFDAERSSLEEYAEPIYQFYLNAGQEPRQFRVLPVSLAEIVAVLIEGRYLLEDDARQTPVGEILSTYRTHFPTPIEIIPIPSRHLAVFDGRAFAHDAGKADIEALVRGEFVPSAEDDLVLALDTIATGHHEGLYEPSRPFLEDV